MALTPKNKNSLTSSNNTIYTLPSYKKPNYNANRKHLHFTTSPPSGKTGPSAKAVDSSPWYTKTLIFLTPVRTQNPFFPHTTLQQKFNPSKFVLETTHT
jgi:hypothetical protein